MIPVDNDLKKMMRDLGDALLHAMATSPKAADNVRRLKHQGYSLYLVLDREAGESSGTQIELTADRPAPSAKPGFRLNKGDVTFLESVGIDATRRGRRRRTS